MKTSTKKSKYYILYKVERDEVGEVIDLHYIKEYTTLKDLVNEQHIHFNNIKSMINKDYNEQLLTFKDLTIIKEFS